MQVENVNSGCPVHITLYALHTRATVWWFGGSDAYMLSAF